MTAESTANRGEGRYHSGDPRHTPISHNEGTALSTITLQGLTQRERDCLRFKTGLENPFDETEFGIAGSLDEIIELFGAVREHLYGAQFDHRAKRETPTKPVGSASKKKSTPSTDVKKLTTGSGYVRWESVINTLVTGETDAYSVTKTRDQSYKLKSTLLGRFPGLEVEIEHGDTTSQVTVKLGAYEPESE